MAQQKARRAALDAAYPPDRPLTAQEIERFLSECGVPNFPFPIDLLPPLVGRAWSGDMVIIQLGANVRVWDRTDPCREISLRFSVQDCYPATMLTRSFVAGRVLRKFLEKIVLHELDECVLFRGARLFDPHADEVEFRILT